MHATDAIRIPRNTLSDLADPFLSHPGAFAFLILTAVAVAVALAYRKY